MKSILLLALCLGLMTACDRDSGVSNAGSGGGSGHVHTAPHGGTIVILAEETHHLECVLSPDKGRLEIFILDGHLENFLRVSQPRLELEVQAGNEVKSLSLQAVGSRATGETPGNTSTFAVEDEWLQSHPRFRARLKAVQIQGKNYESISFSFPEGNEAGGKK